MVLVTFRRCATIAITFSVLAGLVYLPPVRAAKLRPAGSTSESIADLDTNYPPEPRITTSPTIECTGPAGAVVTLDGSASFDRDSTPGTTDDIVTYEWFRDIGRPTAKYLGGQPILGGVALGFGPHDISPRLTDRAGARSLVEIEILVRDTVRPVFEIGVSPPTLWPPNHRMVQVDTDIYVWDLCDPFPSVILVAINTNEPDDASGNGDGSTTGDIVVQETEQTAGRVMLRAERAGGGYGRIYEFIYRATDASGNRMPGFGLVTVPTQLKGRAEPVILRAAVASDGGGLALYWNGVEEATGYDVIAGDLSATRVMDGYLSLGHVEVLAADAAQTYLYVGNFLPTPAVGQVHFFLVQPRIDGVGTGYGTESAPLPRAPESCSFGCP